MSRRLSIIGTGDQVGKPEKVAAVGGRGGS